MGEDEKDFEKQIEQFRKRLQERIQTQMEDMSQMDIITAVSTDIKGKIPSDVKDLARFIEGLQDSTIEFKNPNNSKAVKKEAEPEETKKTSEHLTATILMRTIIELDGDIALLLRSQSVDDGGRQIVVLDNDILAAHQANVKIATENWHFFVLTALDALKALVALGGGK